MTFHKTGSSVKSALNYLESNKDHTNTERINKPSFISGDRNRIEDAENLAKSTGRKCTHSSLTISFRDNELNEFILKNDDGSQQGSYNEKGIFIPKYDEEKLKSFLEKNVISDFRETFFNGLKPDENFLDYFNIHTDKGNVELNCVFLKMELTTGRQFNPFPPGQLSLDLRDSYVDLLNDKFGFDRVLRNPFAISHNDLELKDIKNPSDVATFQKNIVKPKKDEIQKYLSKLVIDGGINNRQDLIKYLQKHGTVNNLDKEDNKNIYNNISFTPDGFDKAIRLQGEMFKKDADFNSLRSEYKNNIAIKKDDLLISQLSDKERSEKTKKLNTHKSISKDRNEKLKSKNVKSIKKHKTRKYTPKSKKKLLKKDDKNNDKKSNSKNENNQQQPKIDNPEQGAAQTVEANNQMSKEVSTDKAKEDLSDIKHQNKNDESKKPTDPKISSSSKSSSSNDDKPSLPSSNSSGGSAVQSLEKEIASFDKQILSLNNSMISIQLKIGSLNMMKESDIRLKFELQGKIAELQIKINEEVAKREIKASALAQAKQDELNKNNKYTPAKPKM